MAIKMLTNEETAFFCEQLAMILEAGIPIADGIEVLAADAGDKRFQEISDTLASFMNEDMTLFDAMEKSGIFPDYAVKMVKIGALTGRLEDTLNGLADYYSKRYAISAKLINNNTCVTVYTFCVLSEFAASAPWRSYRRGERARRDSHDARHRKSPNRRTAPSEADSRWC